MRNKDSGEVEITTAVMVEKFWGEFVEGSKPFETVIISKDGNKTVIEREEGNVIGP